MRLRKKHRSIPSLVTELQTKCPDLTAENIINHESWYKRYLKLREKQKNSVQLWQKQRELKFSSNELVKTFEEFEEKQSLVKLKYNKDEYERKKEMIKKWKEEKEKMRLEDEKVKKNQLAIKNVRKEKERLERTMKMKIAASNVKERRVSQENKLNESYQNKKPFLSKNLIKAFR